MHCFTFVIHLSKLLSEDSLLLSLLDGLADDGDFDARRRLAADVECGTASGRKIGVGPDRDRVLRPAPSCRKVGVGPDRDRLLRPAPRLEGDRCSGSSDAKYAGSKASGTILAIAEAARGGDGSGCGGVAARSASRDGGAGETEARPLRLLRLRVGREGDSEACDSPGVSRYAAGVCESVGARVDATERPGVSQVAACFPSAGTAGHASSSGTESGTGVRGERAALPLCAGLRPEGRGVEGAEGV
mmetsp:Transcript_7742/g.23543  ORF Transcript_7742/g.23543 Transcript_7742/m.23543 type:complete len:245 (+) Transcript_7742:779-1513(+)